MDRHFNNQNVENKDSNEPSEDSFFNQCESCCYEFQQTETYPYKCMYNDILHQYKMRLKKTQMELTDKELMIALLKDQHAKMENYCRCSLEETENIKAKYYQLMQEMENIKREYLIQKNKPVVQGDESLETYLRTEVARWKRENKEILAKIEIMDADVQKMLQAVSNTQRAASEGDMDSRIARLEKIIENQSAILTFLNSKPRQEPRIISEPEMGVEFKMNREPEKIDRALGDVRDEISSTKEITLSIDQTSLDPNFNYAFRTPIAESSMDQKSLQQSDGQASSIVLKPEDDVRISIQIQRGDKSKENDLEKVYSEKFDHKEKTTLENKNTDSEKNDQKPSTTQPIRLEESDSTDTSIMNDFQEIAKKEKKFFDENQVVSTSEFSVFTPTSEHLSAVSELTTSDYEKLFRELPVESNKPPKKNWNDDVFNEFQHFESAFLFNGRNPEDISNIPITNNDNNENLEVTEEVNGKPTIRTLPECCKISDPENRKHGSNFQIVVFDNVDENLIPFCCKPSGVSVESLTIEEIISPVSSAYSDFITRQTRSNQTSSFPAEETPTVSSLGETSASPSKSQKQRKKIPECCRISRSKYDSVIEEISSSLISIDKPRDFEDLSLFPMLSLNLEEDEPTVVLKEINEQYLSDDHIQSTVPEQEKTEDDSPEEIPIIYELEIPPTAIVEEEITRKFVTPFSTEMSRDSETNSRDVAHFNIPESFGEQLQNTVHQLDTIVNAAKEETSTLRNLKEDFEAINKKYNQDISKLNLKVELINKTISGLESDVTSIKNDIKTLLNKHEQDVVKMKRKIENDEDAQKGEKIDNCKVLEKVKNLEKRICRCGPSERRKKICQPSTGCSCKYKMIKECKRSDGDENNSKVKKISFTVQSCALNPSCDVRPPFVVRFGNENLFKDIHSITYKKNDDIKSDEANSPSLPKLETKETDKNQSQFYD